MTPTRLSDGVVTLAPPQASDTADVTHAVQASMPTLSVWMPWATPDYSDENSRFWIEETARTGACGFVIRNPEDEVVGSCGLQNEDGPNRCIQLGYWISAPHTGNGYATRSSRLLIAHAFEDLGIERLEILISVQNEPSQRVAARLGAHLEATLSQRLLVSGERHDAYLYTLFPRGEAPGSADLPSLRSARASA